MVFHKAHSPSPSVFIKLFFFWLALSLRPPAQTGSSIADFSTLKIETMPSSEMSVHTKIIWRHIPEIDILHSCICRIGGLGNIAISLYI
jgi:hypothetical protein